MIILTIPFKTAAQAVSDQEKYVAEYRWQEFRLDLAEESVKLPEQILTEKTILTYRDQSEGGMGNMSFQEKLQLLTEIVKGSDCLLDIELKQYNVRNLPAENLIISYHDLSGEMDKQKLSELISEANAIPAKFLKLAVPVNKYSDLTILKKLILTSNKPVLLAGLGKLSLQTRVLFNHLGAAGTYLAPDNKQILPEQITITDAVRFRLSELTRRSSLTGLVGGNQIYDSLGLEYYNQLFQQKGTDAVYLPFYVEDFQDFRGWLQENRADFCGLSVTMPFKRDICYIAQSEYSVGNLFLPKQNKVFNSDIAAFREAIFRLQIPNDRPVLILGSGATAESALITFEDYADLYLSSRDHRSGNQLAQKYDRKFVAPFNLSASSYDLLINCTPLGRSGEDPLKIYNITPPQAIIDLTYAKNETPLIVYSKENGIKHISGSTFWKWQAKLQTEEFYKCLSE